MPGVESFLRKKSRYFQIYVELESRKNLKDLVNLLRSLDFKINSIEKNPAYIESGLSVYSLMLTTSKNFNHKVLIEDISKLEYVNYCEELN